MCVAGTVATKTIQASSRAVHYQSAVCAEHPMVAGTHYVAITLLEREPYSGPLRMEGARMGVVGQDFDAAGGEMASVSAQGWVLSTDFGSLVHASWPTQTNTIQTNSVLWKGSPEYREIKAGDVVGLLLDLGQRTLSVYLNGARLGVMVAPGMKDTYGYAVAPLAGPLRWAVELRGGASLHIERRPPPGPAPTVEEVAAAVAWNEANHDDVGY
jgi:hypothetical protein